MAVGQEGGRWAHKGNTSSSSEPRVTKRLLPLIPGGLVVERVLPEPDRVTVVARSRLPTSPCPGLSRPLLARAQPLRAAPRRPALAGSSGDHPDPGAAVPLRRARLPEADLRRAAARRRPPLRSPLRAPRRRPAPGRPRPGRRGGNQALGAARHAHQRRHAPAARHVRDTPRAAGAARARGGRVGVAQGPPLRHDPGRPRAQQGRGPAARPRRRLLRRLAARPPRRGGGRPRPGRRLRRRRPARRAAGRPRRRPLAPAAQPRRGRAHRRGRPPRRRPSRRARHRRGAGPPSRPGERPRPPRRERRGRRPGTSLARPATRRSGG